jgi:nucleotide-binding universal stress UspA family protein/tellurite resistance protein/uncharacterized protein (DUF697 family)
MKILVAADISPTAVKICEFLQNYLQLISSETPEVTILHVYEPELDYTEEAPTQNWQPTPTSEHELRHIFQLLATTAKLQYVIVNEGLGDSILKHAATADLVVMGRRRRGQMVEMMTGSLSQFVLHRAPCPVLIVPEPTARQVAAKILKLDSQPPMMSSESLARLKVLIAVAQADGNLNSAERLWLESNIKQQHLPEGIVWETLLTEAMDVDRELAKITDSAQQELTYYAAYLLANTDSEYHPTERELLDRIAQSFNLTTAKVEQLQELVDKVSRFQNSSTGGAIENPEQRSILIEEKILRYATATAILGADPSPLMSSYTQSAALGLQMILIGEIADMCGVGEFAVKPFFEEMVGSLGLVSAWLMALDLAKLVPNVGTSLGAADAFTATWAMGQTTATYFGTIYPESSGLESNALRQLFKQNRKAAEDIYDRDELAISEQKQSYASEMKTLTDGLKTGKLTSETYQKQLQQLLLTVKHPQLVL